MVLEDDAAHAVGTRQHRRVEAVDRSLPVVGRAVHVDVDRAGDGAIVSGVESDWACAGGFTTALRGAAATIASSANAARAVPQRRRSAEPSFMLQGRFCANPGRQSSRSPTSLPFLPVPPYLPFPPPITLAD